MKRKKKNYPKYSVVIDILAVELTDTAGIIYLWTDDNNYYGLRTTQDFVYQVYAWQDAIDANVPQGDECFDKSVELVDIVNDLGFDLINIQFQCMNNELNIVGLCRELETNRKKYIDLVRSLAIESHYHLKVPILVDRRLLIDKTKAPNSKQLPDISIEELESMLKFKKEELIKSQQPTKKYRRKTKLTLLTKFNKGEDLSLEELGKLLENVISQNSAEGFIIAAKVRDKIAEKNNLHTGQQTRQTADDEGSKSE